MYTKLDDLKFNRNPEHIVRTAISLSAKKIEFVQRSQFNEWEMTVFDQSGEVIKQKKLSDHLGGEKFKEFQRFLESTAIKMESKIQEEPNKITINLL